MSDKLAWLEAETKLEFFDYQRDALELAESLSGLQRLCLYYRTGAGKTFTALGALRMWGHQTAVVVAPPSTHAAWEEAGDRFDVTVLPMSHAKFRMAGTKLSRSTAIIADEMHMFGGHKGQGWKKLDRLAAGLKAPLVMASATPNYNDAERVYCIQKILDPHSVKGGFLQFLYQHCTTEQNPFGMEPIVTGFHRFADAEAYLAALPGVAYLPDEVVYTIVDLPYSQPVPPALEEFGYVERSHRMVASQIEERHTRVFLALVDDKGLLREHIYEQLCTLAGNAVTPLLVYADHSTVAEALGRTLEHHRARYGLVTGKTSKKEKARLIQSFRDGELDILVGTASLATGTDGLDKVCDTLVILDDTDDASLRRQLVGRIMPRGTDTDASKKQVYRLVRM